MNQPPPHGWQQGYYPPPPKKSKAPMIIALVGAGLLLLGGVITGLVLYFEANADRGTRKRADQLPALCGNISPAALAKARTTNPNKASSSELDLPYGKKTTCTWNQTEGVDGAGLRNTDVTVIREADDALDEYERSVAQAMANNQGTPQKKSLDGLGDEATAVLVETKSAFTIISIFVRKDDTVVELNYSGWDAGLFSSKRPDVTEFETAATAMAEDMVAKL